MRKPSLLLLAAALGLAAPAGAEPASVRDVRHWSYGAYTRVVVELSRPVATAVQEAPADPASGAPARLYLDLPGVHVGRSRDEPIAVEDGLLRRIRLGQFTRATTRVVLDLERWQRYRLLRLGGPDRIVIDVFGARGAERAPASSARPSMELRPVQRVVVDAGHGGSDPGALGHGRLREKDVTLRLARALRRELSARGFDVVMTRDGDRTLSLLERTALAEGAGGDLFVSLHANSARNRAAEGIEVYTLDENARRQTLRLAARENGVAPGEVDALQGLLTRLRVSEASTRADLLADLVHEEIVRGMARRWPSVASGRGRLRGPFYVLYLSDMPSILVETGFVTHKGDARRLRDPAYLDAMARQIARAIERFRERSGPLVAGAAAVSVPEPVRPWLAELGERGPHAGESAGDVLRAVRGYLAAAREHLAEVHRTSRSGSRVNALHSDLMDRLVRRLFQIAESEYFSEQRDAGDRIAVLAVGGYARREMAIHSDVDLLLLHGEVVTPYLTRIAERIQLWLWDAGLTVGCATRTIADTIELARNDNTVFTGVLDTRFLSGDPVFYHEFLEAIRRELLQDVEQYLARQLAALTDRHNAYGESLYLLQPNVKEGAGGLRDYHAAIWAMRAVLPSTRGLEDLLHYGLLTESEMEAYRDALDFLWHVRNELHLLAKRRQDQMSFEVQEQIAGAFGYPDGGPDAPLPVELFMSDYYRHARAIRNYSELAIEQCRTRARRQPLPTAAPIVVEDGFRLAGDHLEIPHAAHLRERPLRLLSAFAVAQDHDVPLSRTAQRLVRENLHLIDDGLRRDPEATAAFLRILDSEKRVMRSLMTMNELGLLARYLPEWEHIVCRWQHVIYHTYTVDVHSIFLVEELRRLWRGKYERALPELTELMRSCEDRPALFLGSLLHDIGKGFGGEHSAKGAARARACVERLGLEPERLERIVFLVEHHLTMSHIGQRRDLSDPRMILEFAKLARDRTNLKNLYLLTFADMRASSKSGWTEWRGALVRELYERTAEVLETGSPDEAAAFATIEARVEKRRQAARDELQALGIAEAKIDGYFDEMPRRYFVSHTPRQIARHAKTLLAFSDAKQVVTAVREMRGGFSELIVCARDVHGLYWRIAGTLTARGINILSSNVYTTRTGLALEVYRVSTPPGEASDRERIWGGFEESLKRVLAGEVRVEDLVKRRRRPVGVPETPSRLPPSVDVSNDESDFYTIVDVAANDRLGLLYDLTRTLAEHELEIFISKATTVLDQVADTFYVKDAAGRKLADPARVEALRRALLAAVQLEEADHA